MKSRRDLPGGGGGICVGQASHRGHLMMQGRAGDCHLQNPQMDPEQDGQEAGSSSGGRGGTGVIVKTS